MINSAKSLLSVEKREEKGAVGDRNVPVGDVYGKIWGGGRTEKEQPELPGIWFNY